MATEERDGTALDRLVDGLIRASEGAGPLLQRDYWAVVRDSRLTPPEVVDQVASDFDSFAPDELVRFARVGDGSGPLCTGEEMEVDIRMAGECRVRVLHQDRNSFTLGTVYGHPEAGRITFGAYRDDDGAVIFHIRSRARASTAANLAAFLTGGEPMQTTTWTDFVDRVAHTVGDGVDGVIHAETREIEDEPDDPDVICSPTFIATGE